MIKLTQYIHCLLYTSYAKLEKKGIQILTEGEEGDLADESLLLDDGDDSDDSVSSIIGDKYRWSHNDSLDDGDNDEFTSSSADDEEGKKMCIRDSI